MLIFSLNLNLIKSGGFETAGAFVLALPFRRRAFLVPVALQRIHF